MKSLASRVSKCCNAPIMRLTGKEFPDGRTFYKTTSWDACSDCHDEWPEELYACDFCGDAHENLVETNLGMYCHDCTLQHSEDLVERTP